MNAFSVMLPPQSIAPLLGVGNVVNNVLSSRSENGALNMATILRACESVAMNGGNEFFPYAYSGILVAKNGRTLQDICNAISLLERDQSQNPFSGILAKHLRQKKSLEPTALAFSSAGPYDAWQKTAFFRGHMTGVIENVRHFGNTTTPPSKKPVIVDIGSGNGILLTRLVNCLVPIHGIEALHLILVDTFGAMLNSAVSYCRRNISIPLEITRIEARAEELTPLHVSQINSVGPVWFVNASASMHHMHREEKIRALGRLLEISSHCLLTEYEANNDLPGTDSPELIYSIMGFYGYLFHDVLVSPSTEEEKQSCINDFLLAEALVMLRSRQKSGGPEVLGRVDYHTTMEQWLDIANIAGFDANVAKPVVEIPGHRAVTYFLDLERRTNNR